MHEKNALPETRNISDFVNQPTMVATAAAGFHKTIPKGNFALWFKNMS